MYEVWSPRELGMSVEAQLFVVKRGGPLYHNEMFVLVLPIYLPMRDLTPILISTRYFDGYTVWSPSIVRVATPSNVCADCESNEQGRTWIARMTCPSAARPDTSLA